MVRGNGRQRSAIVGLWRAGSSPRAAICCIHGRATIITSQLPIEHWHAWLNDPTLADAILDRLVHQAYRLTLKGESLRKIDRHNTPNENRS